MNLGKIFNRPITASWVGMGEEVNVEGTDVVLMATDKEGHPMLCGGQSVPTAGDGGFAEGCLFISDKLYLNEGDSGSCDFIAVASWSEDDVDTITASGAIDVDVRSTYIDSTSGVQADTLADGVVNQELFLVMIADGGDAVVTPTNLTNGSTITFDDVGDSAHLVFLNDGWVFMGGTATLA